MIEFVRSYREAIDRLYDPANRKVAEAVLVAHIPSMTSDVAKKTCDTLRAARNTGSRTRN